MKTIRLATPLLLVLPLLLGVACDPPGPGASGQLSLSPEVSLEAGRTLEMHLMPDDGQPFDPATADLSDQAWHERESLDLAQIEFPFAYWVGWGIGNTKHERFRLVVWIAESEDVDRIGRGEWFGTRLFSVAECPGPFSGYCDTTPEIDLAIEMRYGEGE